MTSMKTNISKVKGSTNTSATPSQLKNKKPKPRRTNAPRRNKTVTNVMNDKIDEDEMIEIEKPNVNSIETDTNVPSDDQQDNLPDLQNGQPDQPDQPDVMEKLTDNQDEPTSQLNQSDSDDEPIFDTPDGSDSSNADEKYSKLLMGYSKSEEHKKDMEEDIFDKANFRLTIIPIDEKYDILYKLYKKQFSAIWTPEEIDFSNDRHDFMNLIKTNDPEKLEMGKNIQHFIKMILAFFAGADTIVVINIQKKFSRITVKEANLAYTFQEMMENVHGEVYGLMLDNIISDPAEKTELINAFKSVETIKRMIGWAKKWIDSGRRVAFSIVVFTIFEGLMFSGAFAAIYWLKKILGEDKMKGLFQSNNLIAKDEGIHTNFGCVMYSFIKHRLTDEEFNTVMTEAVDISKSFTKDSIRADMIGMNVELMSKYQEYVADRLAVYMGYKKIYNTPNPDVFQYMDSIGFLNKDNFFERRPTEYQKSYNEKNRADWKFKVLNEY
jgi:ribonucleotide reductase beta subunit family protein with ferritin-like domain